MNVVVQWRAGKIHVYTDIKAITYRSNGLPSLFKEENPKIDLSIDYKVIAITD